VVSRQWAFASARSAATATDLIVAANPTTKPVPLRIEAISSGTTTPVAGEAPLSIPPGSRVLVDLKARNVSVDAGLLVTAGAPIVVERVDAGSQTMSATLGIPSVS
jgi:hypothetical protein